MRYPHCRAVIVDFELRSDAQKFPKHWVVPMDVAKASRGCDHEIINVRHLPGHYCDNRLH